MSRAVREDINSTLHQRRREDGPEEYITVRLPDLHARGSTAILSDVCAIIFLPLHHKNQSRASSRPDRAKAIGHCRLAPVLYRR